LPSFEPGSQVRFGAFAKNSRPLRMSLAPPEEGFIIIGTTPGALHD
jgi:hypothetical protein